MAIWPSIDRRAIAAIAGAFLGTRAIIWFLVFSSLALMPLAHPWGLDVHHLLRSGMTQWDSSWYEQIALHAYDPHILNTAAGPPYQHGAPAFFPLYPLLVRIVMFITGDVVIAGLIVSNIAFLAALAYLYALVRMERDAETAERAVFYLAAAPAAVFFTAMYTESVYAAAVIASLYYARRAEWHWAAVAGALASATRNTGWLAALCIATEALQQSGLLVRRSRAGTVTAERDRQRGTEIKSAWRGLVGALCATAGLLAYMLYLQIEFGDPLRFMHDEALWYRQASLQNLWHSVTLLFTTWPVQRDTINGQFFTNVDLNSITALAFLPVIVAVCCTMRPLYVVLVLGSALAPLSSGSLLGFARYSLMLVPCYILLASWGSRRWVDRTITALFLPLMGFYAILYSHWYTLY